MCPIFFCFFVFLSFSFFFFFFNDTATTEIYTLSLHDALPILRRPAGDPQECFGDIFARQRDHPFVNRSEEHTSELQSRGHLVCRLLLEKKKKKKQTTKTTKPNQNENNTQAINKKKTYENMNFT